MPSLARLGLAVLLVGVPAHADTQIDVGGRPVTLNVPPGYDPGAPTPLVLLLHGYSASGAAQESYMQFTPLSDAQGFLFAHPDGTVDCLGNRFWNATDACCQFCLPVIDDSTYLRNVIDEIKAQFNVDDRRVYLIGHSNGGFMSYRMACDHADTIAAIASLAGATFDEPADCAPSEPVHVLQIHGTLDATILYGGGAIGAGTYPGAVEDAETWAAYDGCSGVPDLSAPNLDLEASLAGAESTVRRYASGCQAGGSAEVWTIVGGSHIPSLSATFSQQVIDFLFAHPKPAAASVPALAPLGLALAVGLIAATALARRG